MADHNGRRRYAALPPGTEDPYARDVPQHQHGHGHGHDIYQSSGHPYDETLQSMERSNALEQSVIDFDERKHYSARSYAPEDLPAPPYDDPSQFYPSPLRTSRTESNDRDADEKVQSLTAKDPFNPPSAFPRDGSHHQTAYDTHQESHAGQHDAYAGQDIQQQQQHYFYHQQQFSHYHGEHDAAQGRTMYQNPSGQAYPNWQASNGYQDGAPSWPYPPPYPSDASRAGQYYPTSHYGYHQYDSHGGPPPSYPPPTSALQYHIRAPGGTNASPSRPSVPKKPKEESIKQKKPPAKRDPDKPKRPLSAYNLFFRDERARMLAELNAPEGKSSNDDGDGGKRKSSNDGEEPSAKRKKTIHGVGFKPMAQRVAARWKALGQESLSEYEKLAATDLKRYKQEMKEYRERQTSGTAHAPPP